jgi:hypothetical protein
MIGNTFSELEGEEREEGCPSRRTVELQAGLSRRSFRLTPSMSPSIIGPK